MIATSILHQVVIGAKYDTMDPEHMQWMSTHVRKGRFLLCPKGSHLAEYDDQQVYFSGLIQSFRTCRRIASRLARLALASRSPLARLSHDTSACSQLRPPALYR
jgi:hypothetical protein